ncbi:unnamed protein product [Taenia asiatica]|uniref:Uncharacterized protein n=1 Tax=Taenia asiatica TaxID=60517 RepID=A0A0R3WH19_TAEAS|nr:unnamed protein product [Taenia asiatica]
MTTIPKRDAFLDSTQMTINSNEYILRMRQCKEMSRVPPASVGDVVINLFAQLRSGTCACLLTATPITTTMTVK